MAAITGAVIAAGAAVASASMKSRAIKKAGRQTAEASDAAIVEQQRQFDLTREDFAPILERGNLAGEQEAAFLGLRGAEAEQEAISGFQESPGQAFLRQRQERALLRNEAALGGLGGGNVRTALQEQAFGIASTQLGERKDRLAQVAARGAGATAQGAAIGAGISGNISRIGLGAGRDAAATTAALSEARTSGLKNIAGAFTGSGGIFEQIGTPPIVPPSGRGGFGRSDRRLKTNIRRIGTVNGYPWYSFEWKTGGSATGVMSDEVPAEFVRNIDGFDEVDYGRIL